MYKVHRLPDGDGWVILYQEGESSRCIDGGKTYTKRQAAYRRCKKLNDALRQVNQMIEEKGAIIL